jgi:hypothetical protein
LWRGPPLPGQRRATYACRPRIARGFGAAAMMRWMFMPLLIGLVLLLALWLSA